MYIYEWLGDRGFDPRPFFHWDHFLAIENRIALESNPYSKTLEAKTDAVHLELPLTPIETFQIFSS